MPGMCSQTWQNRRYYRYRYHSVCTCAIEYSMTSLVFRSISSALRLTRCMLEQEQTQRDENKRDRKTSETVVNLVFEVKSV